MRPLEIAVTVALLAYVLHLLSPSRGDSMLFSVLPFLAALLVIGHLMVEGYRWQMAAAYCLTAVLVVYECSRWVWEFRAPYLAGVAALLVELAAIGLSTLLPVFKLPVPTGPYKIGTQIRHLVDEGRRDLFSERSDGARELVIQIWYPADPSIQNEVAPYRDKRITRFKDAQFALVKTHSVLGAPLSRSQSRYPILLYAPSWSGLRTESTTQVEELASHGYIVVGMDHPYSSRITIFPDGRIARRKFTGEEDYSSQDGYESFIRTADQQVEIRARDASFVLDTLERLNVSDPQGLLTGRLEFDRVGIFGFSFGGATAAEACWHDRRFKAGLNLDGMVAGESAKQGIFAPYLVMFEDFSFPLNMDLSSASSSRRREIEFRWEQDAQIRRSLSEYGGYWIVIPGLDHLEFSDFPFVFPLRFGVTDPERTARIIRRYSLAFFDKYLKGLEQPLLNGSSANFPEVSIQAWKAKAPPSPRLGDGP